MKEEQVQDLVQAWTEADCSIEAFLEERYLALHSGGPAAPEEQRKQIRRRLDAWKRNIRRVEERAAELPEDPALKKWQAAEMLDGVIQELEMEPAEEYRYLLNVFLLSGFRLAGQMPSPKAEAVREKLTEEYDLEWSRAETASEPERTERYARTVEMMQYAGIAYHDQTRQILAEIGAGKETQFPETSAADLETLCLLASFLASERVLEEEGSPEEQALLAEEAVPVYAAAEALTQEGRDPGTMEKLAYSLLGAAACGSCMPFLLLTAAYTAVQTAVTAISLAAAGTAVVLGAAALRHIWKAVESTPRPELSFPEKLLQNRPVLSAEEDAARTTARRPAENWNDAYE